MRRGVNVIAAHCAAGQRRPGVSGGCTAIAHALGANTTHVADFASGRGYAALHKATVNSLQRSTQTCVLGGDHSISAATLPGFFDMYRDRALVLWIDAHADINTTSTSPSGNAHGMPLAKVFGLERNTVPQQYLPSFAQLAYVGLRSIDPAEQKVLDVHDVAQFGVNDIARIVDMARDRRVYVSFDVDCLDPSAMPSTGTPVPGGIGIDDALCFLTEVRRTCSIPCFDVVEFNPSIGSLPDMWLSRRNATAAVRALLDPECNARNQMR